MRYFELRKPRIEIIPMIDIMLFLLVFFAMMTLRMIPTTGQLSKLPTSSTTTNMPAPKMLIEIDELGYYTVDGRTVTIDDIGPMVSKHDPATLVVTIAGGKEASMQELMHVIDVVRTAGVTQVGLAARPVP